ncbi:MAG: adenylyltransferase/cytidyltransferase family protein [Patescibacteria group bacterium]
MEKNKVGMVFGVFDGLHQGHRYFLQSAAEQCEQLIVVVAHDETVRELKNRAPKFSLEERMTALRAFPLDMIVVAGDTVQGEWGVLKKYTPSMVFLGHDQTAIAKELTKMHTPFLYIDAHHPEEFKSSLLHEVETKNI